MPGRDVRTVVGGRTLSLSNLDKVLYPAAGVTKAEVISYYLEIAPVLLPHLADRCLTRLRFPEGVAEGAPSFYEKNAPAGTPDWFRTEPVRASDSTISYLVATEPACLVHLANLAALELHAPQWTVPHATRAATGELLIEDPEPRATTLVVDLDPGPGITMVDLAHAALLVANRLAADHLVPHVKTSGSKGLQLSAAIAPTPSGQVVDYVKRVGTELTRRHPDRFVVTMNKAVRAGHIYVDYLQNQAARNTVVVYSLRGREQPWVATPLTWDEVAAVDSPQGLRFTAEDVLRRVQRHGDLFADLLTLSGPPLPPDTVGAGTPTG